MAFKKRIAIGLLVVALLLAGCEFTYDWYTIDCTGFMIDITSGEMTIDNTGEGKEQISVRAVDGAGNVIFDAPNWTTQDVGETVPFWTDFFDWTTPPRANPIMVTYYVPANGILPADIIIHTFTGSCDGLPTIGASAPGVFDGRINRHHIAAPVAIYPVNYGDGMGLHLYRIDESGEGMLALTVSPEAISAVPAQPAENTLIASTPDGSIALYRLTTGEYQVNAGEYVVIFSELHALTDYYMPS